MSGASTILILTVLIVICVVTALIWTAIHLMTQLKYLKIPERSQQQAQQAYTTQGGSMNQTQELANIQAANVAPEQ